ncbi:MAG: hypothetical protein RLZZ414_2035 [Bacteroidota bacterium]|jgi:hypothetical protein
MVKKIKDKVIIIDADVISHFIKANEIYAINSIFKYDILLLDKVYNELKNNLSWQKQIDNLLAQKILKLIPFPENNPNIKVEYFKIKKQMLMGEGESACLAYVKFTQNIIASSNLKDIKQYCIANQITYLTTMDFLCHALQNNIFTLDRCNAFINNVLSNKSRLPVTKMQDYNCRALNLL